MTGARPARADVNERLQLAQRLLRAQLGRDPTVAEVLAVMLDDDVDSLAEEVTEELPKRTLQ